MLSVVRGVDPTGASDKAKGCVRVFILEVTYFLMTPWWTRSCRIHEKPGLELCQCQEVEEGSGASHDNPIPALEALEINHLFRIKLRRRDIEQNLAS